MTLNEHIGLKFREMRKQQTEFTQENISQMLGLSRAAYVNMEAGRQNWYAHQILTLCRIFKCQPNDVFPKVKPVKLKGKSRIKTFTITRTTEVYPRL